MALYSVPITLAYVKLWWYVIELLKLIRADAILVEVVTHTLWHLQVVREEVKHPKFKVSVLHNDLLLPLP